jgi:hypothetical protein
MAHDGDKWIHSRKSNNLPRSLPTAKQKRLLGFGKDDETQS